MPTYLDYLNQARAPVATQLPQVSDATGRALSILQAKSGKSGPAGGVVAGSHIPEQVAVQSGVQQVQEQLAPQINLQGLEQGQKSQQITEAGELAEAEIRQSRNFDTAQNKAKLASIIQELNQARGQLSTEKQQALLHQAGFLTQMQNKQYVSNLEQVGKSQNLSNKFNQLTKIQDLVFGEQLTQLKQVLGQEDLLRSSRRDFQASLANLDLEQAKEIARLEGIYRSHAAEAEKKKLRYGANLEASLGNISAVGQGVSGVIQGGLGAYKASKDADDREELLGAIRAGKLAGTAGAGA